MPVTLTRDEITNRIWRGDYNPPQPSNFTVNMECARRLVNDLEEHFGSRVLDPILRGMMIGIAMELASGEDQAFTFSMFRQYGRVCEMIGRAIEIDLVNREFDNLPEPR